MAKQEPLGRASLRWVCDPAKLGFATTDEVEPLEDNLGQERASEALQFGIEMRHEGYNLFALGLPGTGKHSLVRQCVEAKASTESVPSDWCYINNFAEPNKPRALRLPPGRGAPLRQDMQQLTADLEPAISTTIEGEDYQARRQAIDEEFKERHEHTFGELEQRGRGRGLALVRTPMGFAFAPLDGKEVVSMEKFRSWPEERQAEAKKALSEMEGELQTILKQIPQWQRERRERIRELNHEVTSFAVDHLIDRLREKHSDVPDILVFLESVQKDVVDHADEFISSEAAEAESNPFKAFQRSLAGPKSFSKYQVNVLVDRSEAKAAPVVHEFRPTHPNLLGHLEHQAHFGALTTDFNLIKPGALHQANGGYLVLDARNLLMHPFAWEDLKRALQARAIRIQGIGESFGFASPVSIEPEPIPLDVKIVLVGDRFLYYMLSRLDPDFPKLFKVAVDFDDRVTRDDDTMRRFARTVATIVKEKKLRPFDATAVARTIEHAARLAGDSEKLTLQVRAIADLLCEADHWASDAQKQVVTAVEVQKAIDGQIRRFDRLPRTSQEEIERGRVLIDTEGAVIGQVNGLAVYQLGEMAFGRPSRITARVRLGRGEVVDIEREVALGGPIHSKGVLILAGFLGERYTKDVPLALSASLVFEQSYGGVEGDSASSAELYALLSALSGFPIKQSYAVTGAVNQRGQVQAIGGTNEKIEGFFDLCSARGFAEEQGVLIPAANVKDLMLREDVLKAVDAGKFRVYPVETIDQGIEILTGVSAGEANSEGKFPQGTVNQAVQEQLRTFAERARSFGRRRAKADKEAKE